jgi:hypothetical protein
MQYIGGENQPYNVGVPIMCELHTRKNRAYKRESQLTETIKRMHFSASLLFNCSFLESHNVE